MLAPGCIPAGEERRSRPFLDDGAKWADSPREMAEAVDLIITCLPSPAASVATITDGQCS